MKLDFEYLEKEILATNVKSEYKQSSIIILRNIFKEAETKQLPINGVVKSFYCYDETVQIAQETGDKIIKCGKQCEKCKAI